MPQEDKQQVRTDRHPLTAAELALLGTPHTDLEKRAEVFSFDYERFKVRVSTGDRWQQLLQAHLYFDHVVTQMLVEALKNPDEIDAGRMSFFAKLQLIRALGLLSDDLASAVGFINGLRNKIAHDLNFEINDKDELDFTNCTPLWLRNVMLTDEGREAGALRFHELLQVVLLQTEIIRQKHVLNRLSEQKAIIRLRSVLEKTDGAIYRP